MATRQLHEKQLKCERCGRMMPREKLNTEAFIHHGATELRCLDTRECERARRRHNAR